MRCPQRDAPSSEVSCQPCQVHSFLSGVRDGQRIYRQFMERNKLFGNVDLAYDKDGKSLFTHVIGGEQVFQTAVSYRTFS